MAQRSSRVVCPRCGANNFDTVTQCWKCNAPLGVGTPAAPSYTPSPMGGPVAAPLPPTMAAGAERLGYSAATTAYQLGDTGRANRAAFWLGMLFPYFGFPIGLAFMMCDDRRRQEVGRLCILWSVLSGVVHLLLFFVSVIEVRDLVMSFMGGMRGAASRGGLGGGLGGGGLGGGALGGGF